MEPLSGIILAGGKSSRLGQDKRRLRLWGMEGPTLLEHTVELLSAVCDEVVVVLNDTDEWAGLAARRVPDAYPEGGSMGGIATGLAEVSHSHALVVAADMPLLNRDLLHWMAGQPRTYDILAPRTAGETKSGGWETLCAIYSRGCLPLMQALLRDGNLKLRLVFDQVRVHPIPVEQWQGFEPGGNPFHNINTPADLALAEARLRDESD